MTIENNKAEYHPVTCKRKLNNKAGLEFYRHNILVDNPDPQSHASLILLQRSIHNRRNSEWLHRASRKRKKTFLKRMFQKGDVFCYKCGRKLVPNSAIDCGNKHRATVDHILSISEHPELAKDDKNFRVACNMCNSRRQF